MRLMKIVPLAVLAAAILAPSADANYRVGLSEQSPALFSQPAWQSLKLKRVRYIVPWDYYKDAGQHGEVTSFLNAAHAANQDVLVAFTARRGCYTNGRYSKSRACKAPSTSAYKSAVTRLRGTAFNFTGQPAIRFEVDGELAGNLPTQLNIQPAGLRVLVP